jgi:hypothetical protein
MAEEGGKKNKRETTESTKNIYKNNIIRLNNGNEIKFDKNGIPNLDFLKNTEETLKKFEKLKPNSQRTYLISIVSTLTGLKKYEKVRAVYYDLMDKFNKELKQNNTKSETQQENWIPQSEVLQVYQALGEKVLPLLSLKKVSVSQWDEILSFVVLSLYCLQPPRRNKDYQYMKVIKSPKDLEENYKDFNYYSLAKPPQFLFYNYKTKGTYALQEVPVSTDLNTILKEYMKLHPCKKEKSFFLLVDYKGQPIHQVNAITRILNSIFGKKIGVSLLRSIYLTDKFKAPVNELQNTATAMGTSTNTVQQQYIKND